MSNNKSINSRILSCDSYLPKKIVTNFDLEKSVDTNDAWIVERTGIKERHIAGEDELTSDMAYISAKGAINKAGLKPADIDLIIVATTTPDRTFPSTATAVQHKLGIKTGFAFDIQAVCSGFIYALTVADKFIKTGQVKNAVIIGAETLSKIVDWTDRNTCVLFGDGAGAVVLSASDDDSGILVTSLYSDGSYSDILNTSGGPGISGTSGYIQMAGKEVFKHAVEKMSSCVVDSLKKAKLEVKDIDWLIPHQANARILSAVAKRIGLSEEKVVITVQNHANTSAASIPLALNSVIDKIKKGDIVVMEALGGGLTWGSIVIKW